MANEKLIHASAARKAILDADPRLAYCIDSIQGVDAVEVVRCKDCKHWDEIKHGYGWCCLDKTQHKYAKEEEFCSFGERREGE